MINMSINDLFINGRTLQYSQNCRLRSANRGNTCNTWNVWTDGNVNNNNASNSNRFEPIA